jgi:hypothetical protein
MTLPGGYIAGDVLTAANMNLLPGGVEAGGYAFVTADQTGITTIVDLTSLTVTFTAVTGRLYRVYVEGYAATSVADDIVELSITDASNTQVQARQWVIASTSVSLHISASVLVAPSSGSATYKARLRRVSGTGTIQLSASATAPAYIIIEDVGPA